MYHRNHSFVTGKTIQYSIPCWITISALHNSQEHSCLRLRNSRSFYLNAPTHSASQHAHLPDLRNNKAKYIMTDSSRPLAGMMLPRQLIYSSNRSYHKPKSVTIHNFKKNAFRCRKASLNSKSISQTKPHHTHSLEFVCHMFDPLQLFKNVLLKRIVAPKYLRLNTKQV